MEHAALAEHQQRGVFAHAVQRHLQIAEGEAVHGALRMLSGLAGEGSDVGVVFLVAGHLAVEGKLLALDAEAVLIGILQHLQVVHGQDVRQAPLPQLAVPPGYVQGVVLGAADAGGIHHRQIAAIIRADGSVLSLCLREQRGHHQRAAVCRAFQILAVDDIGVAVHLIQEELFSAAAVQIGV